MKRLKADGFIDGLALGAFLGVEATIFTLWITTEIPPSYNNVVISVSASALTLFAAFIALAGSFRQTMTTREIAENEKAAKRAASRSVLPLVVSSFYSLCENRVHYLLDGKLARKDENWYADDSLIGAIKECVEYSEGEVQSSLQEIISAYQICIARANDYKVSGHLSEAKIEKSECFDRGRAILDWITLQSLSESLFDYSRGRSETVDRMSVPDRARKHVDFLLDDAGWVVTNRKEIEELFSQRLSEDEFGFAHPNWKLR